MYLLRMGKPKLGRSGVALLGAGCFSLVACGGSSAGSATQAAGSAGSEESATHGGEAGSPAASGSNASAGSGSTAQAGSGNIASASGSSGSNTVLPGSAGAANEIDFSHGSRLLIPQRNFTGAHLGPTGDFNELSSVENIDVTVSVDLVDAPTYPRQFEAGFDMPGLFTMGCQLWMGKFEVGSVAVKQDVGGTGAHMKIEQVDGHYLLTHDGPGTHQIRVTGKFLANNGTNGGICHSLPLGEVAVPVAFTTNVNIQRMGSVQTDTWRCGTSPVMLSGRNYPGTQIHFLNEQGKIMQPANVYSTYPLDVLVETEKPAQIVEAGSGLFYDGLIVTGEPQKVRLSTAYGTLLTYQLVDASFIDGLEVEFSSRWSQDVKSPQYPLATDVTPAIAKGKVLVAEATLKVAGVKVCSPILANDFETNLLAPTVCDMQHEVGPDQYPGVPGFLATFVDPNGTCELELSVPAANGGKGLNKHLTSVLVPVNP